MPEHPAVLETEQKPPLLWVQTTVFAATFLIAAIGVPWYALTVGFDTTAVVAFVLFCVLSGISITAGYHRLWAHNAYKAHWSLRLFYALFGAATVQNSILSWVSGHRRHHRYVDDNDRDPYSARRGLWFSHMGWMLRNYPSGREDRSNVTDLMRDPIVRWQDEHYIAITWTMNLAPPIIVGILTGDYLANLLLMGVARLVVTHHTTFFINSLAHYWGRQPYSDENTARDNGLLALLTYGEGYHNFHHRFQTDYRNGIRWFDFDPTKWLIRAASWVGLAWDLRRVDPIRIREAQVAMQLKRAEARLPLLDNVEKWRQLLEDEYAHLRHCVEQWQVIKRESLETSRRAVARQLRALDKALKAQCRRLEMLSLQMATSS